MPTAFALPMTKGSHRRFNYVLQVMSTYPFSLPPFYVAIIRCLGVLEGLAIQVDPNARIWSEAYPYVASRVLTDSHEDLQEALRGLALTPEGHVQWERLENLLDQARMSSGFDIISALNVLSDCLISSADGDSRLLKELTNQVVNAVDALGVELAQFGKETSDTLCIDDVLDAFQTSMEGSDSVTASVQEDFKSMGLSEPTPFMRRFGKMLALLQSQSRKIDPSMLAPIVGKLVGNIKIRVAVSDMIAELGKRAISKGMRAAFGLPPASFEVVSTSDEQSTVPNDANEDE